MDDEKLLLAEYEQYSEAFWRNEEAGERRVTFFTTLTTALITAIVALRTSQFEIPPSEMRQIASLALSGGLIFGLATFLRMLQRDRVTDEYKAKLRYLREQLKTRATGLDEYELPSRTPRHWLLRGGLAVTVALINSFLFGVFTALWSQGAWKWMPAAFLVSFVAHGLCVRARKREEDRAKKEEEQQTKKRDEGLSQTFRAGVGAVIVNAAGNILSLERRDEHGRCRREV
jgi:hypothetical protein